MTTKKTTAKSADEPSRTPKTEPSPVLALTLAETPLARRGEIVELSAADFEQALELNIVRAATTADRALAGRG